MKKDSNGNHIPDWTETLLTRRAKDRAIAYGHNETPQNKRLMRYAFRLARKEQIRPETMKDPRPIFNPIKRKLNQLLRGGK